METLFIYVLKTNSLLLLFWIFYRIFLKKETFYNTIRSYFLFSIAFALIAPALFFTKTVWVEPKISDNTPEDLNTVFAQEVIVEEVPSIIQEPIDYTQLVYYIVCAISIVLTINALFKICKLIRKIKKMDCFKENIKLEKQLKTVYSFGKWVVISPEILQENDFDLILKHEQLHVKLFHTFDLLLLEILTQLFWFNPLIKQLHKDVIVNHEYQVDALLINESNKIRYQMCLLQTQLNHQSSLLCTFNQSELKKRIVQINNQKSKRMKKLKFLLTLPVITGFVLLFQVKTVAQEITIAKAEEVIEENKNNGILLENHSILINKSYDQAYLNSVEKKLREHYKLDFKFKNIKRNKEGYLTNLTIINNDKHNGNNINLTYKNKKGIESFKIAVNKSKNGDYTVKILKYDEPTEGVVYVTNVEDSSKFERNPDPKSGNYFALPDPSKDKVEAAIIDYLAKNNIYDGKLDFSKLTNAKVIILLNNKEVTEITNSELNNLKLFEIYKKELAYNYLGEKAKNGIIVLQTKDYINHTEYKIVNEKKQFVIRNQDGNTKFIKNFKNKSPKKYLIFVDGKQVENADHINDDDIISVDVKTTDLEKYDLKGKNAVLEITTKQNIEEKNTDNKKHNNSIEIKKQAKLDKQKTLKDKKQAEELARQANSNKTNSKYNVSYIATARNTNETPYAYFSEPNKNIKTVYLLDGKPIEKKNINYEKVDYIGIKQDEEAKKLANDQTVDIAVILATREQYNK